jgi:hypothetical protein
VNAMRLYAPEECNGANGYPPEWHETVKHQVREDAGHRCVRCGHPYRRGEHGNGEWSPCDGRCAHGGPMHVETTDGWTSFDPTPEACGPAVMAVAPARVEAQWRILAVHHLDSVKGNCRWWNLPALCQRCHLTIQGRVVMERAFIFEHSPWFRPYAAGWYAWKYEGCEITREEAEADIDRLLALERLA